MVEICVAVADSNSAYGLMRGLAELFDRSSVSFDRTSSEVRVRSEWESRAVMEVIHVVDRWLAAGGIAWRSSRSATAPTHWLAQISPHRHTRERHDRLHPTAQPRDHRRWGTDDPPRYRTRPAPATPSSTALPLLRPIDQRPHLRNLHPV